MHSNWQWGAHAAPGRRRFSLGQLAALAALLLGCGGARQAEARGCGSPAALLGAERAYLVVFRPAERWAPNAALPEAPLQAHARYLLQLFRAGALKAAGRFGDRTGGAMFMAARDDAAALAMVQADPAVQSDVYDFELRPWLLADWAERDATWPR